MAKPRSMQLSDAGLRFIARWEGWRQCRYKDIAGYDTIGYGHLIQPHETFPQCLESKEQGLALLAKDAGFARRAATLYTKWPVSSSQATAIISFCFNLGGRAYSRSSVRMAINRGDFEYAAKRMLLYCYAGGVRSRGLLLRRVAEARLLRLSHSA